MLLPKRGVLVKKCTKCGKILPTLPVNFYRQKGGKYGLKAICKACQKEYYQQNKEHITKHNREYKKQNKEQITKHNKEYYQQNKKRRAEYNKEYRKQNKEQIAKHKKDYRETPHGQVIIFNANIRRRTKEQTQGSGITKDQWYEMMSFFEWKCAYSGITLSKDTRSIDHVVPLNKNGVNEVWNCVPMLRGYNTSKKDRDLMAWYPEQNFYSEERLNKIYEWQEYALNKWGDE